MSPDLHLLYLAALAIAVAHTLLGPDHYLPFVAMSRAGGWTTRKTLWVTALCGVGHVLGSVALGLVGVVLGVSMAQLASIEAARGEVAGWMLLAFGLALFVWGLRRALRYRPHTHAHVHEDGTVHAHKHHHAGDHVHVHARVGRTPATAWVLFVIFLFGPCEPLIPLLMYPALKGGLWHVVMVSVVFGVATIATMSAVVWAGTLGLRPLCRFGLERYGHAVAGLVVFLSGAAVVMGL